MDNAHDDAVTRGDTPGDARVLQSSASTDGGPPFIVAELSKNWINGFPFNGDPILLSQLFERAINHNAARGYQLHSFQLHRVQVSRERFMNPNDDELNETIIAVFVRKGLEAL